MKTKNILKSTLARGAVTASCLGAWKAYDTYGHEKNSLLMQNIEALTAPSESMPYDVCIQTYGQLDPIPSRELGLFIINEN